MAGAAPSGTVTFLFTDIQDSTRLWDESPAEMAAAVQIHDARGMGLSTLLPLLELGIRDIDTSLAGSGGHPATKAQPRHDLSGSRCIHVGGTIITNFGAVDPNTTLGPATGDLRVLRI